MFQKLKLSCSYVWSWALCYSPEIKEKAPHNILCLLLKSRRLELNEFLQNWKPDKCLYKLLLLVSSYSLFINSSWQGKEKQNKQSPIEAVAFALIQETSYRYGQFKWDTNPSTKKLCSNNSTHLKLERAAWSKDRAQHSTLWAYPSPAVCCPLIFVMRDKYFSGKALSPCIPIARCLRLDWQRLPIKELWQEGYWL